MVYPQRKRTLHNKVLVCAPAEAPQPETFTVALPFDMRIFSVCVLIYDPLDTCVYVRFAPWCGAVPIFRKK